jgi:hypothetical protein
VISIERASDSFLRAHGGSLADHESETIPVPVRRDGQVELLIMIYRMTPTPGRPPSPSPPHRAARIHALTGDILAFGPRTPAQLGITDPGARPWPAPTEMVQGANLVDLVQRMRPRLSELSPTLYAAFAARAPVAAVGVSAREFYHLIKELVPPPVSPFYDQAAREFFEYLRRA